jgi:predicted methyltransferase
MATKRPALQTMHDLLAHMQGLGHRVQIAAPLHPGERSEATCPACQGRLVLLAEDHDVEATVTPDLLEPCKPRPLVTLILEATFHPGD